MKRQLVVLALVSLMAAGCAEEQPDGQLPPPKNERTIGRADLGDEWPLTVGSGTLRCLGSGGAGEVVFSAGGTSYAVNGTARSNPGYADLRPIWADDPHTKGLKVSVQPLIREGLKLCVL